MRPTCEGERKNRANETVAFVEESFSIRLVEFSHAKSAGGRTNQTLRLDRIFVCLMPYRSLHVYLSTQQC